MEQSLQAVTPDILQSRAAQLTKQIETATDNLCPLLTLLPALETNDVFLQVKVLNKFSNAALGSVFITGMMIDVMLPQLREVIASQIEVAVLTRNDLQQQLQQIQRQLKALGILQQGEQP